MSENRRNKPGDPHADLLQAVDLPAFFFGDLVRLLEILDQLCSTWRRSRCRPSAAYFEIRRNERIQIGVPMARISLSINTTF